MPAWLPTKLPALVFPPRPLTVEVEEVVAPNPPRLGAELEELANPKEGGAAEEVVVAPKPPRVGATVAVEVVVPNPPNAGAGAAELAAVAPRPKPPKAGAGAEVV